MKNFINGLIKKIPLFDSTKVEHIGKYSIIKEIGQGATATVYQAVHTETMAVVAIKQLSAASHSRFHREMFETEAALCGKMNHPNLVELHYADLQADQPYIVMEYIEGNPLDEYEDRSNLMMLDKVVAAMKQTAVALQYSSNLGILHRDVKPSNLIRRKDGVIKVADFGCALVDDSSTHLGVAGSLPYMSPEQIVGGTITQQSDIYSLGAVFYRLATGYYPILPTEDSDPRSYAHKVLQEDYVPLTEYDKNFSESVAKVIDKMLQKKRNMRYQTWEEVIVDLSSIDNL